MSSLNSLLIALASTILGGFIVAVFGPNLRNYFSKRIVYYRELSEINRIIDWNFRPYNIKILSFYNHSRNIIRDINIHLRYPVEQIFVSDGAASIKDDNKSDVSILLKAIKSKSEIIMVISSEKNPVSITDIISNNVDYIEINNSKYVQYDKYKFSLSAKLFYLVCVLYSFYYFILKPLGLDVTKLTNNN